MSTTLRFVAAVVAGILASLLLVIGVELIGAVAHPTPEGFVGTAEEMNMHVAGIPHWVLAVSVVGWGVTAFVGTWIANRIGGRGAAMVIALLLLVAAAFNVISLPYPTWFKAGAVPVILAGAALAVRLRGESQTSRA